MLTKFHVYAIGLKEVPSTLVMMRKQGIKVDITPLK